MAKIQVWYNDGDLLAGDDVDNYDLDLSCNAYEAQVLARLQEEYPTAEIEIVRNRNMTGYCPSPEYNGRSDSQDGADIEYLDAEVYETYAWLTRLGEM